MHTREVQLHQLRRLLASASETEFGHIHGFSRLAALSDDHVLPAYRQRVPLRDWYGFKDLIARMREGAEPDVLWPGLVRDFCQTSGTTAGDKYIPVSEAMKRSNFRAAMDIFAHAVNAGISIPRIFSGKALFLGGSTSLTTSDKGIRTGDLSGIAATQIRWPISEAYSPGRQIALMDHWPSKIEAMARLVIGQDVRMLSGMPSWSLVLFERMLELARERGMTARCVRDLWPNLQLFVHGGVKYAPFDARVRRLWSGGDHDIPHRIEIYPASEGFVAIQDRPGEPGMRLNTDIGLFFEFVPVEEIDAASPGAHAAWEVEKGQRYVVVLTTCAGLWRYVLGDVVVFDSIPSDGAHAGDGPARLRIVGRHRHFINAFGENLIVEHIESAVTEASRRTGIVVGEFTAAPVYPDAGRRAGLELAVEIESRPLDPVRLEAFRDAFDEAIKAQNVDYTTKRTGSLGMAPPTITPLPPGSFHAWLRSRGKEGGQHKCPRCANHREIIEAVLRAGGALPERESDPDPAVAQAR